MDRFGDDAFALPRTGLLARWATVGSRGPSPRSRLRRRQWLTSGFATTRPFVPRRRDPAGAHACHVRVPPMLAPLDGHPANEHGKQVADITTAGDRQNPVLSTR